MDDDRRMRRWEQRTEIPLFVAALVFLASYAAPVLARDLPAFWRHLCALVPLVVRLVFVADYAVCRRLSGKGLRFVPTHVPHTVVVVLPLLRLLGFSGALAVYQQERGAPAPPCTPSATPCAGPPRPSPRSATATSHRSPRWAG